MEMTIEIRGLRLYSHHGCYAEERRVGTTFIVDADLKVDTTTPAETDDVRDALNYVAACETIARVMGKEHHLLESLVREAISALRREFSAKGLKGGWLRIAKVAPPIGMELGTVALRGEI